MRSTLSFILAGGRGTRLDPLTRDRAKPAVPFGGIYRIIDFTLSNCINSGLRQIYVLTQYKSFSLQKHILAGWDEIVSTQLGEFIDIVPAQQRVSDDWYKGTADAIYQNLYAIEDSQPEHVLILAGDHIYRMNYCEMLREMDNKNADVIVACIPMPKETSTDFGVMEVDSIGRITAFKEKPKDPETIPGAPDQIYASMGIYLFRTKAMMEELKLDAEDESSQNDFGKNIIPKMIERDKNVFVYNFTDENGDPEYWRDIGTRDAYYQANLDFVSPGAKLNPYDKAWPVRTSHSQYPPFRIVAGTKPAQVSDTVGGGGTVIRGAKVTRSVLSTNVKILDGAEVSESVIMSGSVIGEGAKVKNAIIDKEVIVPPGAMIGYDKEQDEKQFALTASGITIVPKRTKIKVEQPVN